MIQEKLLGNIGLNKDDDPRYFGDNDTNHILNMLPDTDESGGLLKTLDGNAEIPTNIDWVLTSSRKVIGTCKRADNDIIYYFVKGLSIHGSETTTTTPMGFDPESELDFEYNSIIEFNPLSGTFRVIVFEEEHLYMGDWVVGAMVFGDYIIYNSGDHGMRKVNIEYAYRYYNGVAGDTYPAITSTTFALRNLPPMSRPICEYDTDSSRIINLLSDKTFQFAYRYKYINAGMSVYSPFSDICLFPAIETYNGNFIGNIYDNNRIEITFERGDLAIIEYVEIIVREGNDGEWRLLSTITEDVSVIYFYNDENYEAVEQDEVNKSEDAIPKQVADCTLISENRLVMGKVTEGFDSVELDVEMLVDTEAITIEDPEPGAITSLNIFQEGWNNSAYSLDTSGLNVGDYAEDDIVSFSIHGDFGDYDFEYVLLLADLVSTTTLAEAIAQALDDNFVTAIGGTAWAISAGSPAVHAITNNDNDDIEMDLLGGFITIWGTVEIIDHTVTSTANKWNTYKSAAIHPHGIEYFDEEFRRSTVMRSTDCDVSVPERGAIGGGTLNYRVVINWTIGHTPPSWARYWRWVYAGNRTQSSFVQYVISALPAESADFPGNLAIDISPLQNLKTDSATNISLPKSIINPYIVAEGDRLRTITGVEAGGGALGATLSGITYHDIPIMGIDGDSILVPMPDAGTYNLGAGSIIEIYTPRTFDENYDLYYPVGPIENVIGGYHMCAAGTDQSAGVDAAGVLESGDAYIIARTFSRTPTGGTDGGLYAVESMHWSDFYQSDAYDRGKPNMLSSIGEVTLNNVRWGWKHFEGASVDNMFTFDPMDYKPLTDIYGDIVRIGEMGDVLKVLFERKVASMYIGKREVYDASGSVFTVQDSVLSNPNYSLEDYGTTDPRAVLFVRGYCYFIDFNAGAVVRNTNNGSYPISGKVDAGGEGADYKMHSYFRDICALALRYGTSSYNVILGWDDGRKVLLVSILKYSCNDYTAVFRESRGRWVSLLELMTDPDADEVFYPTCFQWAGNKFYSWLDGSDSVWLHTYVAATPLSIYGDPKTAQINIWGTAQPNMIKVFDSIAIHTNARGWSGIVAIPESLSYPNGMYSILPESGFEVREGVLYAPYLDNLGTTGAYSVASLYNGESLRGYVIGNQLSISGEAWLFKVDINWRPSNV